MQQWQQSKARATETQPGRQYGQGVGDISKPYKSAEVNATLKEEGEIHFAQVHGIQNPNTWETAKPVYISDLVELSHCVAYYP